MQKNIQIMVSKQKKNINDEKNANIQAVNNDDDHTNYAPDNNNILRPDKPAATTNTSAPNGTQHFCHASKCWLLRAKGILRRPKYCAIKKNMWSGCLNESLRQKKVLQIEHGNFNQYSLKHHLDASFRLDIQPY